MIKLPKKIARTIESEYGSDCTVIKYMYIGCEYKPLCVSFVVFRIGLSNCYNILIYFVDDNYSMVGVYTNSEEVLEELSFQLKKYYLL